MQVAGYMRFILKMLSMRLMIQSFSRCVEQFGHANDCRLRLRDSMPTRRQWPRFWFVFCLPFMLSIAHAQDATSRVLRVGPEYKLKLPSAAAAVARDGDRVEIEGGDYSGDVATWTQNRLMLIGVNGRPHLKAAGQAAEGKAIWVIKGRDVRVQNIEFSGTAVPGFAGAGIRVEGTGLSIRDAHFHDNQMGILTNNDPNSTLTIIGSRFYRNVVDYRRHGRLGHNIYVGRIARFELRDTDVYGAETGHQVKSRARRNKIIGNRIRDINGASSYLIDICEGGEAVIHDNDLLQAARAPNRTAIAFAPEAKDKSAPGSLTVSRNRFVNEGSLGTFVYNHANLQALLEDNRFSGRVRPLRGPGKVRQ
jgi:hypothetical protein